MDRTLHRGLIQVLRLDLGSSSLDGHMMSWLDTSPKATKSRQVSVVPKSEELVYPDANPCPNPWGQKSPGVDGWVALITTLRTLLSITCHGPTCPNRRMRPNLIKILLMWLLGLALTTIKSCDWTSVCLPLTDT